MLQKHSKKGKDFEQNYPTFPHCDCWTCCLFQCIFCSGFLGISFRYESSHALPQLGDRGRAEDGTVDQMVFLTLLKRVPEDLCAIICLRLSLLWPPPPVCPDMKYVVRNHVNYDRVDFVLEWRFFSFTFPQNICTVKEHNLLIQMCSLPLRFL